jgi:hypothetical protein
MMFLAFRLEAREDIFAWLSEGGEGRGLGRGTILFINDKFKKQDQRVYKYSLIPLIRIQKKNFASSNIYTQKQKLAFPTSLMFQYSDSYQNKKRNQNI